MTTALLFGAGGQLGQEIVARAAAFGIAIAARSHAEADIAVAGDVEKALAQTRPAIVVNAAAYTNVDKAEIDADEAFRVNATGADLIAGACASAGVPLVQLSTDYVFDGTKSSPYVETDAAAPLGVYGASKVAGEAAVRARLAKHLILRTSWVYGKFGANFLKTVLRLADERSELKFVADQRGSPTTTLDLADAILGIMPKLASGDANWGTYHFTGDGEATRCQFAEEILNRRQVWAGTRPLLTPIATAEHPTPARRPANSVLDNTLFTTTFRLKAKPWRQSVRETVDALMSPGRA